MKLEVNEVSEMALFAMRLYGTGTFHAGIIRLQSAFRLNLTKLAKKFCSMKKLDLYKKPGSCNDALMCHLLYLLAEMR